MMHPEVTTAVKILETCGNLGEWCADAPWPVPETWRTITTGVDMNPTDFHHVLDLFWKLVDCGYSYDYREFGSLT